MFLKSYLYMALVTTINIVLNGLTLGRYIWLEGRVQRGVFQNWGHRFRYRPKYFAQPRSEEEIVALVRNSRHLRVFGAGHSFNSGVVTDETLVSLDQYSGLLWKDVEKKQMAVAGGTRIRDVNRMMLKEGWAFAALPSHDAQSIAGIISTDVHGTGRKWGFVSQSVVRLKLVDGHGEIIECVPTDDLFKAAIGGIGAVGIIVEVVVQAVNAFNIDQKTEIVERDRVEATLDQLIQENDHLSLYVFPFSNKIQVNTWNHTPRNQSFLGPLREFMDDSIDALVTVWLGNLLAHTGFLPRVSDFALGLRGGKELVLESSEGFNRTIYYLHHELEVAVPHEESFSILRRLIELYERMYAKGLPLTIFELRFTPAGHDRTLIGAGRGRRSTWIDLLCADSAGYEGFLEAAEKYVKEIGARPHLGKYCRSFDREYMEQVHGEYFTRFRRLVQKHDPNCKFVNTFTQRLFEPIAGRTGGTGLSVSMGDDL